MTMVSRYPLSKNIENHVYEILLETIVDLKTSNDVDEFLKEFLSDTEKTVLAKRLSIAALLAKGYDFRSISKTLKVSLPTVSGVNAWMKHKKGAFFKVVEGILVKQKNAEFWNKVDYFLGRATVAMPGTNWSIRRRNLEIERIRNKKPF